MILGVTNTYYLLFINIQIIIHSNIMNNFFMSYLDKPYSLNIKYSLIIKKKQQIPSKCKQTPSMEFLKKM